MKIRNKKTGDIYEIPALRHPTCQMDDIAFFACKDGVGTLFTYNRVADIADEWEDWEDYTPKEPLIKDEKIRKAVRAWAEALDADEIRYNSCAEYSEGRFEAEMGMADIDFGRVIGLKDGDYTIAELCGEEEE